MMLFLIHVAFWRRPLDFKCKNSFHTNEELPPKPFMVNIYDLESVVVLTKCYCMM